MRAIRRIPELLSHSDSGKSVQEHIDSGKSVEDSGKSVQEHIEDAVRHSLSLTFESENSVPVAWPFQQPRKPSETDNHGFEHYLTNNFQPTRVGFSFDGSRLLSMGGTLY